MATQPKIKATFTIDPEAKEMTAGIFCKTFLGKSEAEFIRELQIYGIDNLIKRAKEAGRG